MEFAYIWISMALIFAVIVLVIAGRVMPGEKAPVSMWQTFVSDIATTLAPAGLLIEIAIQKVLVKFGKSPQSLETKQARLAEVRSQRRRDRDIAKMSSMDNADYANSTLDEFLSATATSEPAYAEVDALSEKIEHFYDSVQEKRASAKARR